MDINILGSIVFCYSGMGVSVIPPLCITTETQTGTLFSKQYIKGLVVIISGFHQICSESSTLFPEVTQQAETNSLLLCTGIELWMQNPTLYCTAKAVMQDLPRNGDYLKCCFSHALIKFWILGSSVPFLSWNFTNWKKINKEASFTTLSFLWHKINILPRDVSSTGSFYKWICKQKLNTKGNVIAQLWNPKKIYIPVLGKTDIFVNAKGLLRIEIS